MTLSKPEDFDDKTSMADEQRSPSSHLSYPQPGSVEFSASLETSVPLESPRQAYISVPTQPTVPTQPPLQTDLSLQVDLPLQADLKNQQMSSMPSSVIAEETIQLLEERVVVNRTRRKSGEVVVRKEIETRIIEVPVRREKLIVEQVSPEYKQLAVVDLGQVQEDEVALGTVNAPPLTVEGRFTSVNAAIQFLEAIAAQSDSGLQSVQISVVLKDATSQATYQRLLEQFSARISP